MTGERPREAGPDSTVGESSLVESQVNTHKGESLVLKKKKTKLMREHIEGVWYTKQGEELSRTHLPEGIFPVCLRL